MENKRKLIAIDLDGTLLDDQYRLLPYTQKVLSVLIQMGHMVVLTSGRPFRSMKSYYEQIGGKDPVITYNGGYVFNPADPSFARRRLSFDKDIVKDIYESLKGTTLSFMCEAGTTIYLTKDDPFLDKYFWPKGMEKKIGDISAILDADPMACVFSHERRYDKKVQEVVSKYSDSGVGVRHWNNCLYSELCLKQSSKEEALLYIMKQHGIAKEDTYYFGDSENDYGALENCGHPYAIKGGKSQLLQEKFPLTEFDNNNEGVAKELAKLFSL